MAVAAGGATTRPERPACVTRMGIRSLASLVAAVPILLNKIVVPIRSSDSHLIQRLCFLGTGAFPKFTTLPQHFKEHGFLTMGVGKLFHDGGYGFGGSPEDGEHPAGPGTPPLADPLSWSNVSAQYPQGCVWTAPDPLPPDPTRAAQVSLSLSIYIYIYTYMSVCLSIYECVCVCVCVCVGRFSLRRCVRVCLSTGLGSAV